MVCVPRHPKAHLPSPLPPTRVRSVRVKAIEQRDPHARWMYGLLTCVQIPELNLCHQVTATTRSGASRLGEKIIVWTADGALPKVRNYLCSDLIAWSCDSGSLPACSWPLGWLVTAWTAAECCSFGDKSWWCCSGKFPYRKADTWIPTKPSTKITDQAII